MVRKRIPNSVDESNWGDGFIQEDVASVQQVLADAIEKCARKFAQSIEEGAEGGQVLSIADFVRLLPLLKELRTAEPVKGIEVRWINGPRPESNN